MKTNEIREKYLEFFKRQGHTVCASDVLVPKWDNTVLFTPAGMNPFKDHFLGKVKLDFTRATSCQKCLRTGDIENVGRTAYHHTFFEMLGNFSFGDYFKRDAINWAWEFLTDKTWMGIDPNRLTVTVYLDDDEAFQIWHQDVGLAQDRITRMDEYENFWPAGAPTDGPNGVCGPCSEIFYHPDNGQECEIWNLVFTQFNRVGDPPSNLQPLPNKNIDTGMGLERMAAAMQGVDSNFHIDSLRPLVESCADVCGIQYDPDSENGRRLRRIADHIRACTMAIHENVYPDKNKENYVIRRLLRRALLQGHDMGMQEPFLYKIVPAVVQAMQPAYPELKQTTENVSHVIRIEEEGFLKTLDDGLSRIDNIFKSMEANDSTIVDGRQAFDLFQEQGIPAELFESIARDRDFGFDWQSYQQARAQHAIDSGAGQIGVMGDFGPVDEIKKEYKSTEFLGYECTRNNAQIVGLVSDNQRIDEIQSSESPQLVVLDRTPFYAESGGQVGDTGTITGPSGIFAVVDVQKSGDLLVHHGRVIEGSLAQGESVNVQVDARRREGIARAHSATHIVHYALQKFLGQHAQQRGSKVEDDHLRFDFANLQPVSPDDLIKIEDETNRRVQEAVEITAEILPLEAARSQGAMMLFGEKYPDPVRMVSIGDFSKELCGGTHVVNSSAIGVVELISEEASAAGTRRIVALTGQKAEQHIEETMQSLNQIASLLSVTPSHVFAATRQLMAQLKSLRKQASSGSPSNQAAVDSPTSTGADEPLDYQQSKELLRSVARCLNVSMFEAPQRVQAILEDVSNLKQQIATMADTKSISAEALLEQSTQFGDISVVCAEVPGGNANLLRSLIDQIRKQRQPAAIFLASITGESKVLLVAGLSKDLVQRGMSAGDWVKHVAPKVGGGGGGKPDLAQAGGKQPENIHVALDFAREYMHSETVT